MAKAQSSNPKEKGAPSFEGPRHRPHWVAAFACLLVAVLMLAALISYAPDQSIQTTTNPTGRNQVGIIGAEFSWWAYYLLGACTWLLPVFLLWMTYIYMRSARSLATTRLIAMASCIIAFSGLLAMQSLIFTNLEVFTGGPGGLLGGLVYDQVLRDSLGVFGSAVILGMIYVLGMLFIFTRDIASEMARLMNNFTEWRQKRAALKAALAEENRQRKEESAKQRAAAALAAKSAPAEPAAPPAVSKKMVVPTNNDPLSQQPKIKTTVVPTLPKPVEDEEPVAVAPSPVPEPKLPPKPAPKVVTSQPATPERDLSAVTGKFELNIVKPEETKKAKVTLPQSDDKNYEFPPITLLREQVKNDGLNSVEEHRQNAENLLRILGEFGVNVTLGDIHVGPVITCYEVVPAAGVRVEKISGLDKNIALGMRAQSVRILAPIPGKAAVGVEVPNQKSTPVGMREILESEDWVGAKAELPIALGKDVSGKALISDLAKMPHLLIAGATGSGKSVCINSIVASILYSKSPKDVRLIMVDPKVVELKIFNSLPHMLIPVVTEPKKVPAALKWLLGEMEKRYQIFAKVNVRNIIGFNNRKKDPKHEFPPNSEEQPELEGVLEEVEIPEKLPYIVAIIDELADLMMVAPAEIETSIARLAQLARAAGIHLIIATQRPSVNVITGVIKANLPSRIAFQVASQVDSRTILDTKGADTLIGRGDMLFSPPGSSRLVRAQGAFVADEEVMELVEFLKRNGPPQYAQSVQQQIDRDSRDEDEEGEDGEEDDLGDDEELFQQAMDVLRSTRRASTSMLQRKLRIGYNRAARIVEIMEERGIVGPENGSSPREILVDLDSYQS